MQTKLAYVVGGAVLALAAAHPALAARGEPSYYAPPTFGALDQNRDGLLDRGEVQGRTPLYGQFERFDANRDNRIEPIEFAAYRAQEPSLAADVARSPAPANSATTGRTTPLAANHRHPTFAALDVDADGVLSQGEAAGANNLLDYWDQERRELPNAMTRADFAAAQARYSMGAEPMLAGTR